MEFLKESELFFERLGSDGVLLTAGKDKTNTMTISWGGVGVMWNKPIIIVPIRSSRYTYEFIKETHTFSISIPERNKKQILNIFGSKSGRDIDKYKLANTTTIPCRKIEGKIINEPGFHFECQVIYENSMEMNNLEESIRNAFYGNDKGHNFIIGEILDFYNI